MKQNIYFITKWDNGINGIQETKCFEKSQQTKFYIRPY